MKIVRIHSVPVHIILVLRHEHTRAFQIDGPRFTRFHITIQVCPRSRGRRRPGSIRVFLFQPAEHALHARLVRAFQSAISPQQLLVLLIVSNSDGTVSLTV